MCVFSFRTSLRLHKLASVFILVCSIDFISCLAQGVDIAFASCDTCSAVLMPHSCMLYRHFGRQIAAYDIQTKRCDVYGQGEGYQEQAMLIYDGLHYDALALAAFQDAPEELDVTITETSSSHLPAIQRAAAALTSQVALFCCLPSF